MIHYIWRVYGKPRAQPRPRFSKKTGHAYTNPRSPVHAWRAQVHRTLVDEGYPPEPLTGPVTLKILFRMPRPVKHYGRNGKLKPDTPRAHLQTPDFDNLVKAVCDEMTNLGVWCDDSQVVHAEVHKRWSKAEDAGVSIDLRAPH